MEDEIPALVIDNGSAVIKAGFAGDDAPRTVFPSVVGRLTFPTVRTRGNKNCFVGDEAIATRDILALKSPIERGIISDWQDMEEIWNHTFYNELKVSPDQHSVILTEPPLNPKPNREKMTQIMFEMFNVPGLYTANQAVFAQYASGYTSGVVVSSGEGVTHVVPIYYGHPLDYATMKLDIGGRDLTEFLGKLLGAEQYSDVLRDIKEKKCHVAVDFETELQAIHNGTQAQTSYELPDRSTITLGDASIRCTEAMFQPSLLGIESAGIHELVHAAIMKCHENMRQFIYSNIVLAGGNAMFQDMSERLRNEMLVLAPPNWKPKVIAPPERKYSPWIGGSIVGSLSWWQDALVTRKEFEEYGPKIVHRKCF